MVLCLVKCSVWYRVEPRRRREGTFYSARPPSGPAAGETRRRRLHAFDLLCHLVLLHVEAESDEVTEKVSGEKVVIWLKQDQIGLALGPFRSDMGDIGTDLSVFFLLQFSFLLLFLLYPFFSPLSRFLLFRLSYLFSFSEARTLNN